MVYLAERYASEPARWFPREPAAAAHVQRLLQALLDLPEPEYTHHRLILDDEGRKFSKRDRAVTLRSLRESGVTPAAIRDRLGL